MTTQTPVRNTESKTLLPFLPMIYVAWANGTLGPQELQSLQSSIREHTGLDDETRALLAVWLDPHSPPSAHQLQILLSTIRKSAAQLPESTRLDLADLGYAMAEQVDSASPSVKRALVELQEALGAIGSEASREMLIESPPPPTDREPEPTFDPKALQALLEGKYRAERQRIRSILSHPRFRHEYGLPRAAFRERVLNWCRELAHEGVSGIAYPREYGGEDNLGGFLAIAEELASFDVSLMIKFGVHVGLFGGSVFNLGTERHHREILPKVISLELPGCFAMTETGHGSNVRDIETTATYDKTRGEFIIHTPTPSARKDYIGNAALHARMATVFAQLIIDDTSYGVHAFLVPIRDLQNNALPGIHLEDDGEKIGLNGVDNGRIRFDHIRIPRENLLDRFAQVSPEGHYTSPINSASKRFFTMLGTLVMGRISIAGAATAVSRLGLTIAIRYGAKRRQFGAAGEPETVLLDYQAHQRSLMPLLANAFALTFASAHLAEKMVEHDPDADTRDLESLAAGLKAWASWNNIETLQTCREACGGQGYLSENRFGALKADTDVFATFEGANPVLMQLVAKGLLTEFRHQFSSMKFFGIVKYLTGKAAIAIAEQNPITTRNTDPAHLRDPEFQQAAFRYREDSLLVSVARRLKKKIDAGWDSFHAFNDCQDHLLKLANAHVERIILEQFVARVASLKDDSLKAALKEVCDLFALSRLEADRGWFLEAGYLEAAKSKAIRRENLALCKKVRANALALVEAFGIPDKCLDAPIAG